MRFALEFISGNAAEYRIRARRYLDETWSVLVGDMDISVKHGPDQYPVTTLTGSLPDQTALVGVINRLYGLGMPLLSLECLPAD
jgi:hypothetical protein